MVGGSKELSSESNDVNKVDLSRRMRLLATHLYVWSSCATRTRNRTAILWHSVDKIEGLMKPTSGPKVVSVCKSVSTWTYQVDCWRILGMWRTSKNGNLPPCHAFTELTVEWWWLMVTRPRTVKPFYDLLFCEYKEGLGMLKHFPHLSFLSLLSFGSTPTVPNVVLSTFGIIVNRLYKPHLHLF